MSVAPTVMEPHRTLRPDGSVDSGWTEHRDTANALHGSSGSGGNKSPVVVSTLQGGGRRGYRVDAESAGGGQLIPVAGGGGGPDDVMAQQGHLVPAERERESAEVVAPDIAYAATVGTLSPGAHPSGFNGQDAYTGHLIATAIRTANTGANGHGIAEEAAHTLDGAQGQAVVALVPLAATLSSGGHPGSNAPGRRREDDHTLVAVAPTLTAFNMDSRSPQSEEQQRMVGAVHRASMAVRRLTPVECERLQALPDGWTDPAGADGPRYRCLGNAVTSSVAFWIGERMRRVHEGEEVNRPVDVAGYIERLNA